MAACWSQRSCLRTSSPSSNPSRSRAACAGHGRADLRSHGSGSAASPTIRRARWASRSHRCRARGGRRSHAGGGPRIRPTPRGVRRVDVSQRARDARGPPAVWGAGQQVHRHGCRRRLRWLATAAEHKIKKDGSGAVVRSPKTLTSRTRWPRASAPAWRAVPRRLRGRERKFVAHASRRAQGHPLLVGNIGPLTFGQDDNQLLLGCQRVLAGVAAPPNCPWRELVREIAHGACRRTWIPQRPSSTWTSTSRSSDPRMADQLPAYATPGSAA